MHILLTSDLHYGFNYNSGVILEGWLKSIATKKFDCMIIAGDLISHSQSQRKELCDLLRAYIEVPIYVVHGNHCFWEKNDSAPKDLRLWYSRLMAFAKGVYNNYDIHYLQDNPVITEEYSILGFDGWYESANPVSNDTTHLPKSLAETYQNGPEVHLFLKKIAEEQAQKIINYPTKGRVIIVTHFNTYTRLFFNKHMGGITSLHRFLTEKADYLCEGHTHNEIDYVEGKCRILNAGSDYNDPRHIFFSV